MKNKMLLVCIVAAVFASSVPVFAEYATSMNSFLSTTRMEQGVTVAFGGTWVRNFTVNSVDPNPPIGNNTISSFFDIFTELSLDGGMTWQPRTGSGQINAARELRGNIDGVQTWNIAINQLNANLGGIFLRESPTLTSTGTNTYKPTGSDFRIGSFFDVFTEVSIDGGMTWLPATSVSKDYGQTWMPGNLPMPIGVIEDTPVIIQSAMNLFQPRIGTGQVATVNDFHVRFRVNRWEKNGYNTFLGGPMNRNYLNPAGYYGPAGAIVTSIDQSGDYIEITWTFPTMQISDLSMPWFGFTFGNGIYGVSNGFRYQAVEWYWTFNGVRVTQYDQTDPDVWQDWIKVWNPIAGCWELQDVVVNRELIPRSIAVTAGTQMSPTTPLAIVDLATGGILPPNPVLPPPNPVLPGNGNYVTPWPWPGTDPYYYIYYDVADSATPGASFRNAVILAPIPATSCPSADLTGDCFVNFKDLAVLAQQWLTGIVI